jgi:Tfp pilus assembly protein PilP
MNTFPTPRHLLPLILALLLGAVSCAQAAGLVLPAKRRAAILADGERYLRQTDPQVQERLGELSYPFAFAQEEAPAPVVTDTAAPVQTAPVEVTHTDQEILNLFSDNFRPTGMMARGEVNYLILPVGNRTRSVATGELIRFNYENKSYDIRLESVTDDTFTLRLGEAAVVRRLNESYDADKLKRYNPQP